MIKNGNIRKRNAKSSLDGPMHVILFSASSQYCLTFQLKCKSVVTQNHVIIRTYSPPPQNKQTGLEYNSNQTSQSPTPSTRPLPSPTSSTPPFSYSPSSPPPVSSPNPVPGQNTPRYSSGCRPYAPRRPSRTRQPRAPSPPRRLCVDPCRSRACQASCSWSRGGGGLGPWTQRCRQIIP